MITKNCKRCGAAFTAPNRRFDYCGRDCIKALRRQERSAYHKQRVATDPTYLPEMRRRARAHYHADPQARRDERWLWVMQNPEKYMWSAAKVRASKSGVPFTITPADIAIPDVCPYLGEPLVLGGDPEHSPSLDRKDNTKGYVPGNIEVISHRANRAKNNLSPAELVMMARAILDRFGT